MEHYKKKELEAGLAMRVGAYFALFRKENRNV